MDRADWTQQQQLEEERLSKTLEALEEIDKAGFHEHAAFLAGELGVKTWWTNDSSARSLGR